MDAHFSYLPATGPYEQAFEMQRLKWILPLVLTVNTTTAVASDYCVSSVAEFVDAMAVINNSGGPHHLRIAVGQYPVLDYLGFGPNSALTIEGGFDQTCTSRQYGAQYTTLIAPANADFPPSFHAFGGDLTITDLTLLDFPGAYVWPQGPGHSLTLRRAAFVSKALPFYGAVSIHPTDGSVTLENVVVEGSTDGCALEGAAAGAGHALTAQFVTVRNHGSGDGICFGGAEIGTIVNSILETEGLNDIVAVSTALLITNSVFTSAFGIIDPASSGNLPGPVAFDATADPLLRNRILDDASQPARDSGTALPLVTMDILGMPRPSGLAPDRGAFELQPACDTILQDGFDVPPCTPSQPDRGHSHHATPFCRLALQSC